MKVRRRREYSNRRSMRYASQNADLVENAKWCRADGLCLPARSSAVLTDAGVSASPTLTTYHLGRGLYLLTCSATQIPSIPCSNPSYLFQRVHPFSLKYLPASIKPALIMAASSTETFVPPVQNQNISGITAENNSTLFVGSNTTYHINEGELAPPLASHYYSTARHNESHD